MQGQMDATTIDRAGLIEAGKGLRWFHSIDFGDWVSPGRLPDRPANLTLFPVMDLLQHVDVRGLDCIDTGCADGLSSFGLKMKGAERVVATDIWDNISHTFSISRDVLGLDIEYFSQTTFENILTKFTPHSFDIMVCAGVMYHLLNPFDCILKARKLLKRDGLLILETAYSGGGEPIVDLSTASGKSTEVYTYWMPTKAAVAGMLQLAGFDVLATRSIRMPGRVAMAARNVDFDRVRNRPQSLIERHERGIPDPALQSVLPAGPRAQVPWNGPDDDVVLDWETYRPTFPPHPSR